MADWQHDGLQRLLDGLKTRLDDGDTLAGWKVGLTSGRARDALGPGFRPFGYLLGSRLFESGVDLPLAGNPGISLENELCFVMGKPLQGNPGRAAVQAAIAAVAPAFEVVERRLTGRPEPVQMLVDNLSQWGCVVGAPRKPDLDDFDFTALEVTLSRNGSPVETVEAQGHIDDHFDSIATLVRELGRFGLGLEAGQRVITGAYTLQPAAAGRWSGDFGPALGAVELTLS